MRAVRPAAGLADRVARAHVEARLFGVASKPVRVGRFELRERAGRGGMGTVFKAVDWQRAEPAPAVAVKIIFDGDHSSRALLHERFEREAAALARLSHPHIVGYIDHGVLEDDVAWLAMEWIEGPTLAQLLGERRLSSAETERLARGLAGAIDAAHASNIIHRDIKPANLLLPDGDPARVKVADFGVARLGARRLTETGTTLGTPGYMAPEQAQGKKSIDGRADLFSIGAVLFECLSGRPAFSGPNSVSILAKLLLDNPPRLRELRPALTVEVDELVARLLAKDPAHRVSDAASLVETLARIRPFERPASRHETPVGERVVTTAEQRLVSVLLIGNAAEARTDTLAAPQERAAGPPLVELAGRYRARIEALVDGTIVLDRKSVV